MLRGLISILALISLVGLLGFTQVTNPSTVHPSGLLLVFVFLYLLAFYGLTFLIFWVSAVGAKLLRQYRWIKLSFEKSAALASILALAPVILIGAQSIGGAGISEVLLLLVFEVLGCFYVARRVAN